MELINDFLWVEDKPQFNSKFLENLPNAIYVYVVQIASQDSN